MKKRAILFPIILIIITICLIPVKQEKTLTINASFFNIYNVLGVPENWKNWRPDIASAYKSNPGQFTIKKSTGSFTIQYAGTSVAVKTAGTLFAIDEPSGSYSYFLMPDKYEKKTVVMVNKNATAASYLIGLFTKGSFLSTHIADLKNYMETDSLMYGVKIFKTKVPGANLIVMRKRVLAKDEFTQAASMLLALRAYAKANDVKQTQPLIAQFLPKAKDTAEVNVGLFIDKKINSGNGILFSRMPEGGPLWAARFTGKFNERQKAYIGLHQYFADHLYQSAILPFESYLDNKLPTSDTDKVRVQVNFSSYF
jgi:effector-binding domain-containing protein